MAIKNPQTPGVYTVDDNMSPTSIIGVPTAVPAFVGYSEKAEVAGKSALMQAIRIASLADYEAAFGAGYRPLFGLEEVTGKDLAPTDYDVDVLDVDAKPPITRYYKITDDTSSGTPPVVTRLPRFHLYNSVQLFYANGGGECFVVSVGSYQTAGGAIDGALLEQGLAVLGEVPGPTMVAIPDAVLLTPDVGKPPWQGPEAYWDLCNKMIGQAATLQDRVAILDVYGGQLVDDKTTFEEVIDTFQNGIDASSPSYGVSYFPFLETTLIGAGAIDYQSIASNAFATLRQVLTWQNQHLNGADAVTQQAIADEIAAMQPLTPSQGGRAVVAADGGSESVAALNQKLVAALPLLASVEKILLQKARVVPPSGALAGVIAANDASQGVWTAPANLDLQSVVAPTFQLDTAQQGALNSPVNGRAIDPIRQLPEGGALVWGARTLDGNSQDFRYVQVRRTLIYIEQSIKGGLLSFVFAANDGKTWTAVVSMVSSFLTTLWQQGGLVGNSASQAFSVQCGLGSTMTQQDIIDGYLRVQVLVSPSRPAEFIVLDFLQQVQSDG